MNRSVKSSSNIELSNGIEVDGKVSSSSHVTLSNNVIVHEKINSSSKITLFEGVKVDGKLAARGSIDCGMASVLGTKLMVSWFLVVSMLPHAKYLPSQRF